MDVMSSKVRELREARGRGGGGKEEGAKLRQLTFMAAVCFACAIFTYFNYHTRRKQPSPGE